ncbi:MAG TPA: hypothetical protein VNM66_06680 [Thermodesulfobacteriota bacterium]|nr:hypothetical protein [Thermodesulfobacteriota bacterium]
MRSASPTRPTAVAAALLGAASLGLGGLGEPRPGKIPIPPRNFTAEVTDRQGVVTRANQISCDGEVFLVGQRGETTYAVGFERIRRVRFAPAGERFVEATVELTVEREPLRLRVSRDLVCTGATDFGTVQVKAGDLQTITITGEVREGAPPRGGPGR